jgi:hypothetical protein
VVSVNAKLGDTILVTIVGHRNHGRSRHYWVVHLS